ncbi:MAG: 1,4-alpha-glucan branching enzyme, partial [Actinomycetota bacterium]|nr:1,4-alpha-glucan branching enzyme [Actinomycetota bacterium]
MVTRSDSASAPTEEGSPVSGNEIELIVAGRHGDPHRVLGRHGGVVRAFRPGASAMELVVGEDRVPMTPAHPAGLFEAPIPDGSDDYRLAAEYSTGTTVFDDPYRVWPTLGDLDLHLFG